MEEKYNQIYAKLVDSDDDVVGHIAYSLYKADKLTYIKEYREKHNNADPTDECLRKFKEYCCMDSHVIWYKMQAVEVLKGFVDDTLSETLQQLEKDYILDQNKHLESIIEPLKPSGLWKQYGHGIFQSILGAFFFAFIVAAFAFIKSYSPEGNSLFSIISITKQEQPIEKESCDSAVEDSIPTRINMK